MTKNQKSHAPYLLAQPNHVTWVTSVAASDAIPTRNYLLTRRLINYFRQDARRGTTTAKSFCLINVQMISARQSVVHGCYHDEALFDSVVSVATTTLSRSLQLTACGKILNGNKRRPRGISLKDALTHRFDFKAKTVGSRFEALYLMYTWPLKNV